MPEIPERDRIALELTEKVNKYYRERKDKAKTTVSNEMEHLRHPMVKTPTRALPGSPASASSASSSAAAAGSGGTGTGTSLTSRMEALSPAARHLVTGGLLRLGGGDSMLRASYSQSPAAPRTPGSRTTPRTPGGTPTPSQPHAAASSSTPSWRTPSRTPLPATSKRLPSETQRLGATPASSDEGSAIRSTGTKRNLTDNLLDLPSVKRPASWERSPLGPFLQWILISSKII